MKKTIILLLIFLTLIGCTIRANMDNVQGFSSILSVFKLSEILSMRSSVFVTEKDIYKFQYRFYINNENWIINDRIHDTYVTINGSEHNLANLLLETNLILKNKKNNTEIKIDKEDIIKENSAEMELYGKLSKYKDYIYVTLAYKKLPWGKYFFIEHINNEIITTLNPDLIIGIGETGPL